MSETMARQAPSSAAGTTTDERIRNGYACELVLSTSSGYPATASAGASACAQPGDGAE